jgi:hypothetical protein
MRRISSALLWLHSALGYSSPAEFEQKADSLSLPKVLLRPRNPAPVFV